MMNARYNVHILLVYKVKENNLVYCHFNRIDAL